MPYLFSASLDWCEILLGEIMSRWWFRRNPNCSKLTASCLPLIIPTQPEKDKKTKRRKKKRQKSIQQYKDTKCKVSTTYYSNSTRAGQKDKKKQNANKGENTKWQQKQNEKNTKTQSVRDGLLKKSNCSFGFCPHEGWGGPCPNFMSTYHKLYILCQFGDGEGGGDPWPIFFGTLAFKKSGSSCPT